MQTKILPTLPSCKRYCEPFGGGASILLAREPVEVETYNDVNPALGDFFRVIADPELFEQFYRRVSPLPYSRALYNECRETWRDEPDRIKRAAKWFVVARQSFSGCFGSGWGSTKMGCCAGVAQEPHKWMGAIDRLPEIHARLQRVQIECADWRTILDRYDTPETLFYCDPPYMHGTRRGGKYQHEMRDADHAELVDCLLAVKGKVALSGYPNETYAPLDDAGWTRHTWHTSCNAAGRTRGSGLQGKGTATAKQPRTECLWVKGYDRKELF